MCQGQLINYCTDVTNIGWGGGIFPLIWGRPPFFFLPSIALCPAELLAPHDINKMKNLTPFCQFNRT